MVNTRDRFRLMIIFIHNVWNASQEHRTWLPRVTFGWKPEPTSAVMPRFQSESGSRVVHATSILKYLTVLDDTLNDPASVLVVIINQVRLDIKPYVAPEISRPLPNPRQSLADRLKAVGSQTILVDHDVSQDRDAVEVAESLAKETSTAVAGLAHRLEQLEQSNSTLRREKKRCCKGCVSPVR